MWYIRSWIFIAVFLSGLILPASAYSEHLIDGARWTPVAEDLERSTVQLNVNIFASARIDLFRTSAKRFRMSVARASEFGSKTSDVKTLCQASKGIVCINANFFDEQFRPLGLIIEKGIVLQKIHRGGDTLTGVLQQTRDSINIVNRIDFSSGKVLEAVQAGPRLIVGGQPVSGLKERAPALRRSGICIDPDKRLIFFTITASFFAPSVIDIQKALLHRDIACWDALNLDGGSSTQLYFAGGTAPSGEIISEYEIKGESDIPVIISLIARE